MITKIVLAVALCFLCFEEYQIHTIEHTESTMQTAITQSKKFAASSVKAMSEMSTAAEAFAKAYKQAQADLQESN